MKVLDGRVDNQEREAVKENYIKPQFEPVFKPRYQENYTSAIKCFCICDCGCDKLVAKIISFTMTTPIELVDSG